MRSSTGSGKEPTALYVSGMQPELTVMLLPVCVDVLRVRHAGSQMRSCMPPCDLAWQCLNRDYYVPCFASACLHAVMQGILSTAFLILCLRQGKVSSHWGDSNRHCVPHSASDKAKCLNRDSVPHSASDKARCRATGDIVALKKIRFDHARDGVPVTSIRELRVLQVGLDPRLG